MNKNNLIEDDSRDLAEYILDYLANNGCIAPGFEFVRDMHLGLNNILTGNTVNKNDIESSGQKQYFMIGLHDINENLLYSIVVGLGDNNKVSTIKDNVQKADKFSALTFMAFGFLKNGKFVGCGIENNADAKVATTFNSVIKALMKIIEETCISAFNKKWNDNEWEDL